MADDEIAFAMLSMAETFRILSPPKIKMAIKCARAALKLPEISAPVATHVHFQLGKLLVLYTENYETARDHLEYAYDKMREFGDYLLQNRLECLQLLCELYVHALIAPQTSMRICQMIKQELASQYVRESPQITSKFYFYFIEASCNAGNTAAAIECCDLGISTFHHNPIMELYYRITKALVYIRYLETNLSDEEQQKIISLLDTLDPMSPHAVNLNLFFECIQLAVHINEGTVNSCRALINRVQKRVQGLTEDNTIKMGIRWMDFVPLTAVVCLLTIANSAHLYNIERIPKYFHLIIRQSNEYLTKMARLPCEYGLMRCIQRVRLISNEFASQAHIMECKPLDALNNVKDMIVLYSKLSPKCSLSTEFAHVIQNLLGLYCQYLREDRLAEEHFIAALKMCPPLAKNAQILINANLALVYMLQCKQAEYYSVAENLVPNRVDPCTYVVRANVKFAQAFHYYMVNKANDFRTVSEMALNMVKSQKLSRLHNLFILLCSQFYSVDIDTLNLCKTLSAKVSDHMLIEWNQKTLAASEIMKDKGVDSKEWEEAEEKAREACSKDTVWQSHLGHTSKDLIKWVGGDITPYMGE